LHISSQRGQLEAIRMLVHAGAAYWMRDLVRALSQPPQQYHTFQH